MTPFQENTQKDGRTENRQKDRQTLFYRALQAIARGAKEMF